MIIPNSIKVKNYKCFGEIQQGFERICLLNIIIGKNNSGKSSLIDLIDYVVNPNQAFWDVGRGVNKSEVWISDFISKKVIEHSIPGGISGGGIPGPDHHTYGLSFVNSKIEYTLGYNKRKSIVSWEKEFITTQENYVSRIQDNLTSPFEGKIFKRINAERDIKPYGADEANIGIGSDGNGATNVVRRIINDAEYNADIIQRELLEKLNEITSPDVEFTQVTTKKYKDGVWEIYFKVKNGDTVPLSKMGSGIKSILLVLLNLLVIPKIENTKPENLIFGFEELENNLHPSMQRRLLNFIIQFAEANNSYFFITTHSNIVIDIFSRIEISQIIHVENYNNSTVVRTLSTMLDGRNILKDLDYKASDILLSNGVIWVEGPSDALYLELLFDLYTKKHGDVRKVNYSIQTLATAIWKFAGFTDFEWAKINDDMKNKIISLAKINHNHLIILDNDNNYENKKPSQYDDFEDSIGKTKCRLVHELMRFAGQNEEDLETNYGDTKAGRLFFWINEGTFETYLEHFIKTNGGAFKKYFDLKKTRGYFEKKREGSNYSKSKVELASEIAQYAIQNNLSFDDFAPQESSLEIKFKKLVETVKDWNK